MILSEEKSSDQIEKKLQTGRSFLKKADTDPIIQIKKRLKELDAEWVRVMNVSLPKENNNDKIYRLCRNERYRTAKKIEQKIIECNFALQILENTATF